MDVSSVNRLTSLNALGGGRVFPRPAATRNSALADADEVGCRRRRWSGEAVGWLVGKGAGRLLKAAEGEKTVYKGDTFMIPLA